MTSTLLLAAVSLTGLGAQEPGGVSPSELISRMLQRYSSARSLTGSIVLSVTTMGQTAQARTDVQFELPSKLYLRQSRATASCLVTSDGKRFSYDAPKLTWHDKGVRLVEPVSLSNGKTLAVRDIYAAATASLIDRSAPLDIAIGRREDLEFLRRQWATLRYQGKVSHDGAEVHAITGDWKEYGDAPRTSGSFRMLISDSGDLKQYAVSETVDVPPLGNKTVVSVWEVSLTVNGKPNAELFRVAG